jgi:hypothetical protein
MTIPSVIKMSVALIAALFSATLVAAPISIVSLPTETSGGFQHNNFHDATLQQGADGNKLAWFDLGAGGGSYDNVTGDFIVNIDLYGDTGLSNFIGTAVGTGNLDPLAFNSLDGGLIGTLSWDFDASAEAAGLTDTTMSFMDVYYGKTSTAGYIPNTAVGKSMTLWGSDGNLDPITGLYEGVGIAPTIGVDFVATFVPIPAAAWLFGSGLLAMIGVARRRTR